MKNQIPAVLPAVIPAALLSVLAACPAPTNNEPTIIPPGDEARSALSRDENPNPPAEDVANLVAGNTAFATDLYHVIDEDNDAAENYFYSPYSISIALSMTYAAARNQTETDFANVLHFLPQDAQHPAFNRLALDLDGRGQNLPADSTADPFRLNVVNDVWAQNGFAMLPSFLDTLAVNYGAGVRLVDFVGDPDGSRTAINDYVTDKTEDKITDLLPEGSITPDTRLVLTNAIYFKASWETAFNKDATSAGDFRNIGGDVSSVDMMHGSMEALYAENDSYQAADLPYAGGELSMLVVVPKDGSFDTFEESLDGEVLDSITDGFLNAEVQLSLPKFTVKSNVPMGKHLKSMGLEPAFDDRADLSGIDGVDQYHISDVLHQAFVAVDESGTEAAAATAVVINVDSAAPDFAELNVDKPFIFAIRDRLTGTLLFVGRVVSL